MKESEILSFSLAAMVMANVIKGQQMWKDVIGVSRNAIKLHRKESAAIAALSNISIERTMNIISRHIMEAIESRSFDKIQDVYRGLNPDIMRLGFRKENSRHIHDHEIEFLYELCVDDTLLAISKALAEYAGLLNFKDGEPTDR